MKVVNKLVRDKIPKIIEGDGRSCKTRILKDDEYIRELNKKLQEEVNEYLESGDIMELADIEEVLKAILDYKQISHNDFEKVREEKLAKNGGFSDKIFLESILDKTKDKD